MSSTIQQIKPRVPKTKQQKVILAVGAAGAAGFVFYMYRKNQEAAASATAVDAYDQSATDATDPYGDPYGDYTDPGGGGYSPPWGEWQPPTGTQEPPPSNTPTTFDQWARQVEDYLTKHGYDRRAVIEALTDWRRKRDLTDNQIAIVEAGIAFRGEPPNSPGTPHRKKPAPNPPPGKWYRRIPDGAVFVVQGNVRYRMPWNEWQQVQTKPRVKWITRADPVFKLKNGGSI